MSRPISPVPYSVNHTAPSGPATIEFGERPCSHSAPSAVGGSEHVGVSVSPARASGTTATESDGEQGQDGAAGHG